MRGELQRGLDPEDQGAVREGVRYRIGIAAGRRAGGSLHQAQRAAEEPDAGVARQVQARQPCHGAGPRDWRVRRHRTQLQAEEVDAPVRGSYSLPALRQRVALLLADLEQVDLVAEYTPGHSEQALGLGGVLI